MDRKCFSPFSLVPLVLLLVSLTGCASFPRQEISDAWILVEAAKDSCAKVYMPEELEEATTKLDAIEAGSQKPNRKSKKELTAMALEVQALAKGMVNEAARCLEEEVVRSAADLDLAMIMGTGFPPFRGGLCRWADRQGLAELVTLLEGMATDFGERFHPSAALVRATEAGGLYALFG